MEGSQGKRRSGFMISLHLVHKTSKFGGRDGLVASESFYLPITRCKSSADPINMSNWHFMNMCTLINYNNIIFTPVRFCVQVMRTNKIGKTSIFMKILLACLHHFGDDLHQGSILESSGYSFLITQLLINFIARAMCAFLDADVNSEARR